MCCQSFVREFVRRAGISVREFVRGGRIFVREFVRWGEISVREFVSGGGRNLCQRVCQAPRGGQRSVRSYCTLSSSCLGLFGHPPSSDEEFGPSDQLSDEESGPSDELADGEFGPSDKLSDEEFAP